MTYRHPRILDCADILWDEDTPVSRHSGDVYFSRSGGVRESRLLFLEGNRLPERLPVAPGPFCIGETGFGTGLNFLLARRLFLARAPSVSSLHFVSFEQAPLSHRDRRRFRDLLAARGEAALAADADLLDRHHPPPVSGWHRIVLDEGRVRLSLWFGDASTGLADWQRSGGAAADAWFLDGFAPSVNPELWDEALAHRLAARSHRDTTLATFSVARGVREALAGAGFHVEKVPGPPGKREMLIGSATADGPRRRPASRPPQVTVAGAGLAGATVARACADRGMNVRVLDASDPAGGASGNRHAVLHPRLPLDDGPRSALLLAAQAFTRRWLDRPDWRHAFRPRTVLQFPEARRPERLGKVRRRFGALDGFVVWHGDAADLRLEWPDGGNADLPALVAALLDHPAIAVEARALAPPDREHGAPLVLAAGSASGSLLERPLPIGRMRGQLTRVRGAEEPGAPILTGRGHAVPLSDGWSVGSSYRRLEGAPAADDARPSLEEREENLARLRAWGALRGTVPWEGVAVEDWAGVRATTPDRAPVVGELEADLWISTGHASSGLLTCPLAAEAIAAALCGEPPVLDRALGELLAPARFGRRDG